MSENAASKTPESGNKPPIRVVNCPQLNLEDLHKVFEFEEIPRKPHKAPQALVMTLNFDDLICLEMTQRFAAELPNTKLLALTNLNGREKFHEQLKKLGAHSVIGIDSKTEEVIAALNALLNK